MVVAGCDPRSGRGKGGYLRVHWGLPHLWVVELVVGEHHVNGGLNSGGRWFGRCWISSGRATKVELKLGLEYWVHQRAADAVWEAEVASPK